MISTENSSVSCAIYVRVSTEEQAKEGLSIKAQMDRCKAFCIARNWEVFKVYKDAGFSGASMDRPGLQLLLADAEAQKFSVILVYKIDRFSRKLKDLILTLEELKKEKIHFTSVTEQIDTTSAMGEAYFQMIGVFAQLERGMISERVQLVFRSKIDSGEYLNRAPLGYRYQDKKLIVHAEEAAKVKEIFNMRAAGVHYKEIASKFSLPISTLYALLHNVTYVGKIKYQGKLYTGNHEALIDEELFNKVNNIEKKVHTTLDKF
jgi:site-specific DNA recombinase